MPPVSNYNFKIINDPIYGCIGLSETEVKLLDTKAMQRLRRINQMGFASYVFPGGEHSRFIHSIGVLAIMGKMCEHLYGLYGTKSKNKDGFSFNYKDITKLRIAALLHDVGHFPFSHLSECVYSFIEQQEINKIVSSRINNNNNILSELANFKKKKQIDHEHLGAEVIRRDDEINGILREIKINPEEIGRIIIGDTQTNPIYAQLLHSSLDADRLDYLLRDSRQAGVAFGTIELNYIIEQMRVYNCNISDNGSDNVKIPLIVFRDKAKHALEHFLMARYFHYTQVVQHKTAIAFESIAKLLEYEMIHNAKKTTICGLKTYHDIVNCINTDIFYNFTDDFMWERIKEYAEYNNNDYIQKQWKCLARRIKPVIVIQTADILPKISSYERERSCNDSKYLLTKWIIKNEIDQIARQTKINKKYIGYVENYVGLESISSHIKADDCLKDGNFDDATRGAIRIIDNNENVSFLASDKKSLINKMVDFTSNNFIIFVIGIDDNNKIRKFKEVISAKVESD